MTKVSHNYLQAGAVGYDYSQRLCTRCATYQPKTDFPKPNSGYISTYCIPCAVAHVQALDEISQAFTNKLPPATCAVCASRSCTRHTTGETK